MRWKASLERVLEACGELSLYESNSVVEHCTHTVHAARRYGAPAQVREDNYYNTIHNIAMKKKRIL